ncbi:hypothetical protein F4808DRAFT_436186 [Astrocystis sublimbata]|nr:hypothetical protein F4808DRAFT_436186 [Astrocystis sublimbata]
MPGIRQSRFSRLLYLILSQWIILVFSQIGGECDADSQGLELNEPQIGSPTADMSPGLGFEFETGAFTLVGNPECDIHQTNELKARILGGRKGDTWALTVDTTLETPNRLQPEYIMDGLKVKIDQNMAGKAAAEIAADLVDWNPSTNSPALTVEGLDGCTWTIKSETGSKLMAPDQLLWQRQITTPMPLEALHDIIDKFRWPVGTQFRSLRPSARWAEKMIFVSHEFFQTAPEGVPTNPDADVLGFFSMILSYIKAAGIEKPDPYRSPKFLLPIMPRNDFQTMFNLIKSGLGSMDSGPDALYHIVRAISCYKWDLSGDEPYLDIDTSYCSEDWDSPKIKKDIGEISFEFRGFKRNPQTNVEETESYSFTVKEWLNDLQANRGDRLSMGDEFHDKQIGGFKDKMEFALGTTRLVPLFEFRNLGPLASPQFSAVVTAAERDIIYLHRTFGAASRPAKRQLAGCPTNMTTSALSSRPVTAPPSSFTPIPSPTIRPTLTPTLTPPFMSSSHPIISSFKTSFSPTTTPTPTISCRLQNQDPDMGINSRYCVCEESITAPILGSTLAQSELCAYTATPTTTQTISRPTHTYTAGCDACTIVGGIADSPTCTTIEGCAPTITAWVGNLDSIDIGDAEDGNGGKDLAMELFTKLRPVCGDMGCDTEHLTATMDNVETLLTDGSEVPLKPAMRLSDAEYNNDPEIFERMLSLGIATWVSTINQNQDMFCQEVEYEADEDFSGSGCGTGPIPQDRLRRTVHRDTGAVLWQRDDVAALEERCRDFCDAPVTCKYHGRVCRAPRLVVVSQPPYHLALTVELQETGDAFTCEEIVMDFFEVLAFIFPEFLPEEEGGLIGAEALCHLPEDIQNLGHGLPNAITT